MMEDEIAGCEHAFHVSCAMTLAEMEGKYYTDIECPTCSKAFVVATHDWVPVGHMGGLAAVLYRRGLAAMMQCVGTVQNAALPQACSYTVVIILLQRHCRTGLVM